MSFTQDQLTAIDEALASGTLRVRYADREVWYRTTAELINLRDMIRRDLGLLTNAVTHVYLSHSKGLDDAGS